jgi:hypothetical protein
MVMRKYLQLLVNAIALVFTCNSVAFSQNLNLNNQGGTSTSYAIQDVRNITFENADLIVLLNNGNSYTFSLAGLTNYRYNESEAGVDEILSVVNDWKVNVYPIPATQQLTIEYTLIEPELIYYVIADLNGKQVLKDVLGIQNSGPHSVNISLEDLPNGNYNLQLFQEGQVFSTKISKQ